MGMAFPHVPLEMTPVAACSTCAFSTVAILDGRTVRNKPAFNMSVGFCNVGCGWRATPLKWNQIKMQSLYTWATSMCALYRPIERKKRTGECCTQLHRLHYSTNFVCISLSISISPSVRLSVCPCVSACLTRVYKVAPKSTPLYSESSDSTSR